VRTCRRLTLLGGLSMVALVAALILPGGQASRQSARSSYSLDPGACSALRALTTQLENGAHAPHRSVDCVVHVTTATRSMPATLLSRLGLGTARAEAATSCQGYWKHYDFTWWLSGDVNVGMCADGKTVHSSWGPDCSVSKGAYSWEYADTISWCGVYQNGTPNPQPGMNFHLNPYYAPMWEQMRCWVRFTAYPQGGMDGGRGSC
jgi:hypothetical protein